MEPERDLEHEKELLGEASRGRLDGFDASIYGWEAPVDHWIFPKSSILKSSYCTATPL